MMYGFNFPRVRKDNPTAYHMTRVFYLLETKLALAELQGQVGLMQLCEDPLEMLEVFSPSQAVHNHVMIVCSRELPTVVESGRWLVQYGAQRA